MSEVINATPDDNAHDSKRDGQEQIQDAKRFDTLMHNESRADKLDRVILHLSRAAADVAAATKLMVDINMEHPITMEDVEAISTEFVQVRAMSMMITGLVRARFPLAFDEKQKDNEGRGEGRQG